MVGSKVGRWEGGTQFFLAFSDHFQSIFTSRNRQKTTGRALFSLKSLVVGSGLHVSRTKAAKYGEVALQRERLGSRVGHDERSGREPDIPIPIRPACPVASTPATGWLGSGTL